MESAPKATQGKAFAELLNKGGAGENRLKGDGLESNGIDERRESESLDVLEERVEARECAMEEVESRRGTERQLERQETWRGEGEEAMKAKAEAEGEQTFVGELDRYGFRESFREKVVRSAEDSVDGLEASIDADTGIGAADQTPSEIGKTEETPPAQQVAQEIVEAIHVGQDQQARKIVLVDVNIPGKGNVRIRLRRQGDSIEVRMRTQDQDLARELRAGRDTLREAGRQRGVQFTSIEIVS